MSVAERLRRVLDRIGEAAVRAGRAPEEITLVGVSKTHSSDEVVAAVHAGLRHVGENRVQEAAEKFPQVRAALTGLDVPVYHMVGHLQSNKAGAAVDLFSRIDSVDSVKLGSALARRVASDTRPLPVLVEVYVGDDPRRPGVRPDALVDVVGALLEFPALKVEGLMSVAPLGADARGAFATVRQLKQTLSERFPVVHFGVLSMGMSEDFVDAIQEGSTEVRIGTAIFGPRQPVD